MPRLQLAAYIFKYLRSVNMFTQTVMQAFRSVFVALLIGSVFPRWCAAQESKVDASVLTAAADAINGIGGYLSPR